VADILCGLEWNEAVFPEADRIELDRGLVSILAFRPDRSPELQGTAFISGSYGSHAVAISAAHVFHEGVAKTQNPNPLYHRSALRQFLPDGEEFDLDRRNLRALYRNGNRWEFCIISSLVMHRPSDLAFMTLHLQDQTDNSLFDTHFKFGHLKPRIGDIVGVLGYADMATLSEYREGDLETAMLQRRLVYRAGSVRAIHSDGHILCRGACIETTIPVFGGMSGGPAFLVPEPGKSIVPFGFISHDPKSEESIDEKNHRSRAGSAIISVLPHEISNEMGEKRDVRFHLANVSFVRNAEFVRPTSVGMHFSPENQS
jgi:hypothetical protein